MPLSPPPPPAPDPSPPQLFLHKPSKAQLKKAKARAGSAPPHAPGASMDPPSSSSSSSSAVPELKPKKPFLRRIFPLLLVANFAVGAYVLLRTTDKQSAEKDEEVPAEEEVASAPVERAKSEVPQEPPIQPAEVPKKVLPPIPQDEQRELFKWILEEKRKIKPTNSSEKKKLDEEKALLKQYVQAKSIPTL